MGAMQVSRCLIALLVATAVVGVTTASAGERGVAMVVRTIIYPGDVIREDAVVEQVMPAGPGGFSNIYPGREDVIGKIARRTLLRGQPISASELREKDAVKQGRTYTLIYRTPGLSLRGTGVPLQSVGAGQLVRVRNPDTGNIIEARATADETLIVEGR